MRSAKPKPLSPRQVALIERLRGGRVLISSPRGCYIEHPYSDEDARTVGSLIDRKLLKLEGAEGFHRDAGLWILDEGKTP